MSSSSAMRADLSPDAAAVHAVAEALRQAINRSDVDGAVACWAADGIMLPPSHPPVRGHAAIAEYFARAFAARRLTFTFTEAQVEVVGDLAIERLHYTVVGTAANGEAFDGAGKGIHIYSRRTDGAWQLAQDIWNSDRPA